MRDLITTDLARSGVRLSTPILFAAIGSAMCARAGVLNLAIEAKMLMGAFAAIYTAYLVGSTAIGALAAAGLGLLIGLLLGWMLARFSMDLVIVAIALNLLALELTVYLMRAWFDGVGTWSDPSVTRMSDIVVPVIADVPVLGALISGYNPLVYLSWFAAFAFWLMFRTRFGRHLVAVGQAPDAAAAVGISVQRVQTTALMTAGALAGLGGAYLSVGNLALFTRNITDSRGWIAITAALLALNRPLGVVAAAALFGFSDAFAIRLQVTTDIPPSLVQFLPQFLALGAIILVGVRSVRRPKPVDDEPDDHAAGDPMGPDGTLPTRQTTPPDLPATALATPDGHSPPGET